MKITHLGKEYNIEPGVYLYRANLSGAKLYRANLSGAKLSVTNLSEAYLTEANLSKANFYRANLHGANLHGANLTGANFYRANLSGTLITQDQLSLCQCYSIILGHIAILVVEPPKNTTTLFKFLYGKPLQEITTFSEIFSYDYSGELDRIMKLRAFL
jgi:Pentapeptide repeats (8 copies)